MIKYLNLSIRGATIVFKSLLIFYIAKNFTVSDMAIYGLFTVTILYFLYFIGLDLYIFFSRELVHISTEKWGGKLKHIILIYALMYFLSLFLIYYIIELKIIPSNLGLVFVFILFIEHINQEFSRLMILKGDVLRSTIINFIRYAAWTPILIVLFYFNFIEKSLNNIFIFWALFGAIAIICNLVSFKSYKIKNWEEKIELKWLLKGVSICLPFLLGTLALRGLTTVDRYFLEHNFSAEYLASYVFYGSFVAVIATIVDSLVLSYSYPKLLKYYNSEMREEYNKEIKSMLTQTIKYSLGFSLILYYLTFFIIKFIIKNEIYLINMHSFILMLVASVVMSISMVPHYILYSQKKDKLIIFIHVLSFLIFVIILFFLHEYFSAVIVPIMLLLVNVFILVTKSFFALRNVRSS